MTPVAVLGAGFQGVCLALELARRGVDVHLYDRHDACITQAGARNEGKIHLGFVYANDPSFETARLLIRGALTFDRTLRRWLECDVAEWGLSTPHYYAVHRDSMLSPDVVMAHFARVRDHVHAVGHAERWTYLGQDARSLSFEPVEIESAYDPATVAAVVSTDERAVDAERIAACLRARVASEPRITFHPHAEITGAAHEQDSVLVAVTQDGTAATRAYRQVVNCLWDGRLAIDRSLQYGPEARTFYRLKYGIRLTLREPVTVPSTTFVVGPFGDVVQWNGGQLYLSWYPVAKRTTAGGTAPPSWPREISGRAAEEMIDATLDAFARLVTPMRTLHRGSIRDVSVAGGVIVAAGQTDIDDPHSRLHTRTAVGVRSAGRYHSVDPGKYTMAPMFAMETADRVCGAPAPSHER